MPGGRAQARKRRQQQRRASLAAKPLVQSDLVREHMDAQGNRFVPMNMNGASLGRVLVSSVFSAVLLGWGTAPPKAPEDKLNFIDCDCTEDEGCRYHAELYLFSLLVKFDCGLPSQKLLNLIRATWSSMEHDYGKLDAEKVRHLLTVLQLSEGI